MQPRYALMAVALVALALVPAVAMAGGFGPKASPLGQKHGQNAPDWAGNATALRANASAGAGDGSCDGDCLDARNRTWARNGSCDGTRTQLGDGRDRRARVHDGARTQLRDRTCTGRETASPGAKRAGPQARNQSAACC